MKKPDLFVSVDTKRFKCLLCPHFCILSSGMRGLCKIRIADESGIHSTSRPVTVHAVDPIEKKPFYHFLPGSDSLSIGFAGCNLKCPFCQNHSLLDSTDFNRKISSEKILQAALSLGLSTVSFTYSEPLIHIEFVVKTARLLRKNRIYSLLITNGCINEKPGEWLLSSLDGVKVDLKSFNPLWYKSELRGNLDAVKRFISKAAKMTHLEVVTLVIPGKNDNPHEIESAARFLSENNPDIPYHLTAYYPQYNYNVPPTSPLLLEKLKKIASRHLTYVYTGNTGRMESTCCPVCGSIVIDRRSGIERLCAENKCPSCGQYIYGIFTNEKIN